VAFSPPPRFPSIALDLNVTVPAKTECAAVVAAVPALAHLVSVRAIDLYPLAEGARVTLAMQFNAGDRTLGQDEAMASMATIRAAMDARGWVAG
jgi:phenylalanyl-tRNA synthetase beta subunit